MGANLLSNINNVVVQLRLVFVKCQGKSEQNQTKEKDSPGAECDKEAINMAVNEVLHDDLHVIMSDLLMTNKQILRKILPQNIASLLCMKRFKINITRYKNSKPKFSC